MNRFGYSNLFDVLQSTFERRRPIIKSHKFCILITLNSTTVSMIAFTSSLCSVSYVFASTCGLVADKRKQIWLRCIDKLDSIHS